MMRQSFLLPMLLVLALLGLGAAATPLQEPARQQAWDTETVELFATLAIQDGGRVKPMDSFAGLRLLMLNGKRTLRLEDGEKLEPSAWALEVIFFPEDAKNQNCIRIENDGVLVNLTLAAKKKRDWYSYNELLPAREAIQREAMAASKKDTDKRSAVERQMLKLHSDLYNFDALLGMFEPLRVNFDIGASERLMQIFGGNIVASPVDLFMNMEALIKLRNQTDASYAADREVLAELLAATDQARNRGGIGPSFVPPSGSFAKKDTWWRVGELVDIGKMNADGTEVGAPDQLEVLGMLAQLERNKLDPVLFKQDMRALHAKLKQMAEVRGDYKHINQEVALYKTAPFDKALVCFLLGFILMAASFLSPKLSWLVWVIWALAIVAFVYLVFGITMRSIIRSRPPVVSLYDTILFVSAVAILAALVMEWLTRMRVGLGLSLVLGVFGMFLAGKYELKEIASAGDTMASVVAVLDTNYYLAIHVTTIAIGYSGGLLAAAIAHIWILGKLFRIREGDKAFYKSVSRMIYGAVCFSLLFAVFGTVMGAFGLTILGGVFGVGILRKTARS